MDSNEYTPKLFKEETEQNNFTNKDQTEEKLENQMLFDQDNNDEEDFEIPAFLRRQKF